MEPPQGFHRAVRVDRMGAAGADPELRRITASAAERRALAERFGLLALDELAAQARLWRQGSRVHLRVNFTAAVVQSCVVTLEPVSEHIAHTFERAYLPPAASPGASAKEVRVAIDGDEAEPLGGNEIDLGEAVAEELALALNPYPRTPGLAFSRIRGGRSAAKERVSRARGFEGKVGALAHPREHSAVVHHQGAAWHRGPASGRHHGSTEKEGLEIAPRQTALASRVGGRGLCRVFELRRTQAASSRVRRLWSV